jgi:hypothetical protein
MKAVHTQNVLLLGLALAACRTDSTGASTEALTPGSLAASLAADEDQFTDWSPPVNPGPPINTTLAEQEPFISKDGLSLYFQCNNCLGGLGGIDIWVAQRISRDDPWGTPRNLGSTINTEFNDLPSAVSNDGHRLYFNSLRPGGFGGNDLYVARRHDKRDDFAWQNPVNLGSGVNSDANEFQAVPFEDDVTGTITLYFTSNRAGGLGAEDIYASTLRPDQTFGPAVLVVELSTPFIDQQTAIRRDGLEMILASNRSGTLGGSDLWVATRASTSDPWSTPRNLGSVINGAATDGAPALSFDGTELYFFSNRPGGLGGFDVYVSTRGKLKAPD